MKYKEMTDEEREYLSAWANVQSVRNWLRDGKIADMADRLNNVLSYLEIRHDPKSKRANGRKHKHMRPMRKRQARAASLARV